MTSPTQIPLLHRIIAKLLKWLFVSMLIGLLPVLLKVIFLYAADVDASKGKILGSGELFLVAAGLTASGVGDLFFELKAPGSTVTTNPALQVFRAVAVVLSVIIVLIGAAVYGTSNGESNVTENYMDLSIMVLVGAAVSSACCVIVSEFK